MARKNLGRTERILSLLLGSVTAAAGVRSGTRLGRGMAFLGGLLAMRAATGHSFVYDRLGLSSAELDEGAGVNVETAVVVDRPAEEVYGYWRDLDNLAAFMTDVESVETIEPGVTHWVVRGPRGRKLEWDAEIIEQHAPRVVSWRTVPGSRFEQAGSVHFDPIDHRGTRVHVKMRLRPYGGPLGLTYAKMTRPFAEREVTEDLRRFKRIVETGETPTTAGQPHGARR